MVFFKDIPVAIEFCRRYQNFFLTISEHSPYKEDCGLFNTILSGRHSRNCVDCYWLYICCRKRKVLWGIERICFWSEGHFSNFRKDTFHSERATGEPSDAHNSNFLHPVLYFYKEPPTGNTMESLVSVIVYRTEFVSIDKILGNTP